MKIRIWDPVVRIFHWSTAGIFFINYWLVDSGPLHRWLGYGVAGLLMTRTVWGVIGSPYARFRSFFPTPTRIIKYLHGLRGGEHPGYPGHNPVGAMMIFTLLVLLLLLCLSGWMMGWDMFWGVDWVEDTHETVATLLHILVGIHVAAIFLTDFFYHQGLFRSMITGFKEVYQPTEH